MDEIARASEQVSLFCRINHTIKRDLPIRSSEMGLLIYLVKTEKEKTPNAAAQFFTVTKAMITNMVTSLRAKGYLEKKQSKIDRRSSLLLPTEKAIHLVELAYEEYFKAMTTLEAKMGKQKFHEFITLLETANEILLEVKSNG